MARVVVAGASGVVGNAALESFASAGWDAVAVSRRVPELPDGQVFRHLPLDLRDRPACERAVQDSADVTHLVYAALFEKPGLVAGWRERDQMQTNLAMLRNLLDPLVRAGALQHVSLLQGTKAYGAHLPGPFPVPARERDVRRDHENFYWLQEDELRRQADAHGFRSTILRPQLVFGRPFGVAMNLVPVLGAYAAICREEGLAFGFPGGASYVVEAVDARLVGDALRWAATAPQAADEVFNVTNGDVMTWRGVWPAIADTLGVEPATDTPRRLATVRLPEHAATWDRVVERHGLRRLGLAELLGESHHYADFCFAHGVGRPPRPVLVSTIKLRQAGFSDCIDTEDMLRHWLRDLQRRGVLPPP